MAQKVTILLFLNFQLNTFKEKSSVPDISWKNRPVCTNFTTPPLYVAVAQGQYATSLEGIHPYTPFYLWCLPACCLLGS